MKTSDFYYDLPPELIAQHPAQKRDESRLLVYHRDSKQVEDRHFYDLPQYLRPGDCLVLNRTRVIPARLIGERITEDGTKGGAMEFLLLKRLSDCRWETLVKPGRRAKTGARFRFGDELTAEVEESTPTGGGSCALRLRVFGKRCWSAPAACRCRPTSPNSSKTKSATKRYTPRKKVRPPRPRRGCTLPRSCWSDPSMGVSVVEILLHVGLGTFRPVKAENIEDHQMHSEYYEVSEENAAALNACRAAGGRIVCVGTTSCRTLETATDEAGVVHAQSGWTDIFITPGYRFKAVDALVTNFHLPESTLLMLVSALSTREEMLSVYRHAVEERYRFFSFGDAMLIL